MKESYYPDDIMLCFVQGFGDRDNGYNKSREVAECDVNSSTLRRKQKRKRVPIVKDPNTELTLGAYSDVEIRREINLLESSSKDKFLQDLPEVKRSFSDRFSVITDGSGRKGPKGLLTIRKTW
ncbi:unnamed protein product, partial [Brenthis ino]